MHSAAAAIIFSLMALGQTTSDLDIVSTAKSPDDLARYLRSHTNIDWKALRRALGLKESEYWLAPCGSNFPVAKAPCSVNIEAVAKPDQVIIAIRGDELAYTVEYLRYLKDSRGGWKFAGENSAFQRNSPSSHRIVRFWNKPFLLISSDLSQIGMATQQKLEEWFDLTRSDLDPVFSVTVDGGEWRFGLGVGRTIHATYTLPQTAGIERIELTLDVSFDGVGLDQRDSFLGLYERRTNENGFTLRKAYLGSDRRTSMSTKDFQELADPFSGVPNEKLLVYALPGLRKIAVGSDGNAKDWLRSVLDYAKDTQEKRALLALLANR
jgi:hypothetical protein